MFDFLDRFVSSYIPIQGHVRSGVWILDDASVYAMVEVSGRPWETSEPSVLQSWKLGLNQLFRNISDSTIIISVYECHGMASPDVYPTGTFRSAFAESLDVGYRAKLFERGLFRNRTIVGIQVRPPRYAGEFIGEQMELRREKPAEEAPEDRIQRLEDVCALLMSQLSALRPRRLGVVERRNMLFSEMAEALVFALTGVHRAVGLTTGRLGESMISEQIIPRRETIEYVGPGRSWFGAMFGMKHFPAWTWPGMLGDLLGAPYRCTVFHSFRFIDTADAQSLMKRKRSRMLLAEDPAESQAEALLQAADHLGSADWVFGDYCFSLLVFADTERGLVDVATAAWSDLAEAGMTVARETRALESALYSMIPGNARYRPRPGYVSSLNMASLAPMHAYPTGAARGYWGEPVALFRTKGGTPYRYHFHVGDVGNTFICGRTGSGKSTMIGYLVAQAERHDATVVIFDKDRGLKILVNALGGSYVELKNDIAPLKRLTDSADDRRFLVTLIRGLILSDGGEQLAPEEDRRLSLGVKIVMSLPPQDRSLREVRNFLGVGSNSAGARLQKWCHGSELGWIIDNEEDLIALDVHVLGFDQTLILDNAMARGPVMATLYHYVNKLIDGRKLLFVIDEFWKSLLDPAFRALVNDKLRTLRKLNSPMILATQSPRDALVSEIRHTIRDQCPSQFYFGNGQATWDDFGEPGMGLTHTELDVVRSMPVGQGEFLLKQGDYSVRLELPLGGMPDEISVLSGRESTTRIFERVQKTLGTRDPVRLLNAFREACKEEEVS